MSVGADAPEDGLDNPAWSALSGPQAPIAERVGRAARYLPRLSAMAALADDDSAWADAARLPGARSLFVVAPPSPPPPGWIVRYEGVGIQMVAPDLEGEPDPGAIPLGAADVVEMLDLVKRTRPGPFLPGTVEFGGYLGLRHEGALVAMAGERLRVPGWTEISAVCTAEEFRGQGLAARLTLAVAAAIRARGDTPFLHATANNVTAIRLYESLGFQLRRDAIFVIARAPAGPPEP